MASKRIYFCYLKNTSANACELGRTEKETAHLGGKCEANNGMTPAIGV